jgi:hypothetical protein
MERSDADTAPPLPFDGDADDDDDDVNVDAKNDSRVGATVVRLYGEGDGASRKPRLPREDADMALQGKRGFKAPVLCAPSVQKEVVRVRAREFVEVKSAPRLA